MRKMRFKDIYVNCPGLHFIDRAGAGLQVKRSKARGKRNILQHAPACASAELSQKCPWSNTSCCSVKELSVNQKTLSRLSRAVPNSDRVGLQGLVTSPWQSSRLPPASVLAKRPASSFPVPEAKLWPVSLALRREAVKKTLGRA